MSAYITASVHETLRRWPELPEHARILEMDCGTGVLRPGGYVVITDGCRDYLSIRWLGLGLQLTGKPCHHSCRTQELQKRLQQARFSNIDMDCDRISSPWSMMAAVATRIQRCLRNGSSNWAL